MNPMTNVKNIKKLNEQELRRNLKTSWHDQYKDSAWIFVGGLPYDLTEGDIICVFSQYGEVVNINLVRDKDTGKQKGFCFLCYEDQQSTVLAVDNFNGIKLLGRTLRVDHVADYKAPKDSAKKDAETRRLQEEGCAVTSETLVPNMKKEKLEDRDDCVILEKETPEVDLVKDIKSESKSRKKKKEKVPSKMKVKKERDSERKKKKTKKRDSSSSSSDNSSESSSSSDSSNDSSTEESDSEEEKARARKRKHKLAKKKKTKHAENVPESESSATSKRRKLEEKIKALEKALNSVRSGKGKPK